MESLAINGNSEVPRARAFVKAGRSRTRTAREAVPSPDHADEIAHGDEDALATRLTGPSPEMEERLRRAEQNLRI